MATCWSPGAESRLSPLCYEGLAGTLENETPMIESIYIEGFRSFRDADLGPLSNVNVIVGAGNTGKSSLLEAAFISCGIGAPVLFLKALAQRGIQMETRTAPEEANQG